MLCQKCGLRDCQCTEHLSKQIDNLKEQLKHQDVYILNLEGQVDALNLSITIINRRLMEATDIINQYTNGNASLLLLQQRADKFLKGEK